MKCIKCNEELEADDNFCPTCGELTPHGYLSLKDNKLRYKENNIGLLFTLTSIIIISFIAMTLISGKSNLKYKRRSHKSNKTRYHKTILEM